MKILRKLWNRVSGSINPKAEPTGRELMRLTAARLRSIPPELYCQEDWRGTAECGTFGCVALHTLIAAGEDPYDFASQDIGDEAARRLELTEAQADHLFTAFASEVWWSPYRQRLKSEKEKNLVAADYLDAIADGEVRL